VFCDFECSSTLSWLTMLDCCRAWLLIDDDRDVDMVDSVESEM
jgi:hypothetical protein